MCLQIIIRAFNPNDLPGFQRCCGINLLKLPSLAHQHMYCGGAALLHMCMGKTWIQKGKGGIRTFPAIRGGLAVADIVVDIWPCEIFLRRTKCSSVHTPQDEHCKVELLISVQTHIAKLYAVCQ